VAKSAKPEAEREEITPPKFPEIAPPYAQAVGSAWLAESVMQMQQAIGELKATVGHLKTASDKQGEKLDTISHRVYAAGVVVTLALGVVGFFLEQNLGRRIHLAKGGDTLVASQASSMSTTSLISQSRFVMPAAIAGDVRSVLWTRTKL
jgi:hypothetical protein